MAVALLTLALVGTLALGATTIGGHLATGSTASIRQHFVAALGSTFILVMAHSFILFFLLATGVEMKKMEQREGWGDSFRRRTVALKSRVFPAVTLALLLVMANFILGAGAHTRALPGWLHGGLAWITLAVCLRALEREYRALGENNRLIAEAASRREDTGPALRV